MKKLQIYKLYRCSDKGKKIKGQFVSLVELHHSFSSNFAMECIEVNDSLEHKFNETNCAWITHFCFKPAIMVQENGSIQVDGYEYLEDRKTRIAAIFLLVPYTFSLLRLF